MGATGSVRQRCRVAAEPNRDRAVTLYGSDGRTYQVIDSATAVREQLKQLGPGDTVGVVLEPVRCRGDGWRITRLDEMTPRKSFERPLSDPEDQFATEQTSR